MMVRLQLSCVLVQCLCGEGAFHLWVFSLSLSLFQRTIQDGCCCSVQRRVHRLFVFLFHWILIPVSTVESNQHCIGSQDSGYTNRHFSRSLESDGAVVVKI